MAIIERGLKIIVLFTVFVFLFSFNVNASHVYEWNRTIGGASNDNAYSVAVDSSSNIYVVGYTDSFGTPEDYDFWTVKYTSAGTQLWNKTIGGSNFDGAEEVAIDNAGNLYITGSTESFGAGFSDIWTIKYDSDGNYIWNKTIGGSSSDNSGGIAIDSSNNLYVAGHTSSFGPGSTNLLIIKYNSDGNQIWNRTFGVSGKTCVSGGITLDSSNNVYMAGNSDLISYGDEDSDNFLIVKYDSSGSQIWNRTYGTNRSDTPYAITADSSGDIYAVGYMGTENSGEEVFIVKYDSDGNYQWNISAGYASEDIAYDVITDSSDNLYVAAKTYYESGEQADFWTFKYDSDGNHIWNKTFGTNFSDYSQGIALDLQGNLFLAGSTQLSGNGDFIMLKYSNALPNSTGFGSGSTDFDTVSDITSVSNMILMNANGRIHWNNPVNAAYQNYSDYVIIDTGFVSLDTDKLHASIDSEAEVNLSGVNCANFNLYYATGIHQSLEALVAAGSVVATQDNLGGDCTDAGICTGLECTGTNLVFTAQHFDGFGAGEGGSESQTVPEFSTWAMIIGLLGAFMGLSFIRKQ